MIFRLALFSALVSSVALGQSERVKMSDMSDNSSPKDTILTVSRAYEAEDLDLLESCFAASQRKNIRKKCGIMFVKGRSSMSIVESHVIEIEDEKAEVAVRYMMSEPSGPVEIVSTVNMSKEGDRWVINKEVLVSRSSGRAEAPFAQARQANGRADGEWDPMNPDPSRISPNLQHLIGDIGIQPGMGCQNGRCGVGGCDLK